MQAASNVTQPVRFWKIIVPAGQPSLTVSVTGESGSTFLYVRKGVAPTPLDHDCFADMGNTGVATCTINQPAATTWYVMLGNQTGSFSGSLRATPAGPRRGPSDSRRSD